MLHFLLVSLKLPFYSSDDAFNEVVSKRSRRTPPMHICRVCYCSRLDEEVRTSSRSRDQNIVLLSCLVLCHEIDIEQAKETYLQTLFKKKAICQRHYIQAVSMSVTLP